MPLMLLTCGPLEFQSVTPSLAPATATANSAKTVRPQQPPTSIKKQLFSGQVVMLREALKRKGVQSTTEFDKLVVLETNEGELIPIVPDWRGRAFYQDKRLRKRPVQLVGYRRKGIPYLQVLMIFTLDHNKSTNSHPKKRQAKPIRHYFDYWCDICSIPMYEIKQCECCQGPIRMRYQPRGLPSYISVDPTGKTTGRESAK
jgi:hypothetical protein